MGRFVLERIVKRLSNKKSVYTSRMFGSLNTVFLPIFLSPRLRSRPDEPDFSTYLTVAVTVLSHF